LKNWNVRLKYVMEFRSKLFDSDNIVKLWKANQLQYFRGRGEGVLGGLEPHINQ
jgi:hypothetical protein